MGVAFFNSFKGVIYWGMSEISKGGGVTKIREADIKNESALSVHFDLSYPRQPNFGAV